MVDKEEEIIESLRATRCDSPQHASLGTLTSEMQQEENKLFEKARENASTPVFLDSILSTLIDPSTGSMGLSMGAATRAAIKIQSLCRGKKARGSVAEAKVGKMQKFIASRVTATEVPKAVEEQIGEAMAWKKRAVAAIQRGYHKYQVRQRRRRQEMVMASFIQRQYKGYKRSKTKKLEEGKATVIQHKYRAYVTRKSDGMDLCARQRSQSPSGSLPLALSRGSSPSSSSASPVQGPAVDLLQRALRVAPVDNEIRDLVAAMPEPQSMASVKGKGKGSCKGSARVHSPKRPVPARQASGKGAPLRPKSAGTVARNKSKSGDLEEKVADIPDEPNVQILNLDEMNDDVTDSKPESSQRFLEGEIPSSMKDTFSPGYYWAWQNDDGTYDMCMNPEGTVAHLPASKIPEEISRLRQEKTTAKPVPPPKLSARKRKEPDDIFMMPTTPSAASRPKVNMDDFVSGSQVKSVRLLKQMGSEMHTVSPHWVSSLSARQRAEKRIGIPATTSGRPATAPKRYKQPTAAPEWDPSAPLLNAVIPQYDALFDYGCHNLHPRILKGVRERRDLPQEYQYVLRERMEQFMERRNGASPTRGRVGIDWHGSQLYQTVVAARNAGRTGEFYEERYARVIHAIEHSGTIGPHSMEESCSSAKWSLTELMNELQIGSVDDSQYATPCSKELHALLRSPATACSYFSILATIKELLMYRRKTLELISLLIRFDFDFQELCANSYALVLSDPRLNITVERLRQWAQSASKIRSLFHSWSERFSRFAAVTDGRGTFIWQQKPILRHVEECVHIVQQGGESAVGNEDEGCGAILSRIFRTTFFAVDDPLSEGPAPGWYSPGVVDTIREKMRRTAPPRATFRRSRWVPRDSGPQPVSTAPAPRVPNPSARRSAGKPGIAQLYAS